MVFTNHQWRRCIPDRSRAVQLLYGGLRIMGVVLLSSAVFQVASFLAGVYVIRSLPEADYALFSIALSMLGILNSFADSGVTQAVVAMGGKNHKDRSALSVIVASARKQLTLNGFAATSVVVPLWVWLSWKHSHSVALIGGIGVVLIFAFFANLEASIYRTLLLLDGRIGVSQFWDSLTVVLRLFLLLPSLVVFPTAVVTLLAGAIPEVLRCQIFKRDAFRTLISSAPGDPRIAREIRSFIARTLPVNIYNAFSGQILFVLMTLISTTTTVAGAGALSRLNQCFLIVTTVMSVALVPRFAKHSNHRTLIPAFWGCFAGGAGLALGVSLVILCFPSVILLALGPSYSGLIVETRLLAVTSGLSAIAGTLFGLCAARGWIIPPQLLIPVNILSLCIGLCFFRVDSVLGYFQLGVVTQSCIFALSLAWAIYSLAKHGAVKI